MKKSFVLFFTLLFIIAISTLIMQNMGDLSSYINNKDINFTKMEELGLVSNLQKEISKQIQLNSNNMNKYINKYFSNYVPFTIGKDKLYFKLVPYSKININDIDNAKDFFYKNEIYDIDSLKDLVKKSSTIDSTKKVIGIIKEFDLNNYDKKLINLKDYIGFYKNDGLYELFIKINKNKNPMKFYYVLNKQGEVKYFEFSSKK